MHLPDEAVASGRHLLDHSTRLEKVLARPWHHFSTQSPIIPFQDRSSKLECSISFTNQVLFVLTTHPRVPDVLSQQISTAIAKGGHSPVTLLKMSRTGSLREEFARAKLSNLVIMNWSDGKLYHTNDPTERRGNRARRLSKEGFGRSDLSPSSSRRPNRGPSDFSPYQSVPASTRLSHHFSQPGSPPTRNVNTPEKWARDLALHDNLPTTVDEFIKEWKGEPAMGRDGIRDPTGAENGDEKWIQKILSMPPLVPSRAPPMQVTKKRRLRETKITDVEQFKRQRRETLSHVIQGHQELRRIMNGVRHRPQLQDVKIRIGSQEKRLGASSTDNTKSSQMVTTLLPPVQTGARRTPVPSLTKSSSGMFLLFHLQTLMFC